MGVNDWEKWKKRKSDNIGFISRSNAFREPTEAEKAVALAKEIESWQATIGVKTYTLSKEYKIAKGQRRDRFLIFLETEKRKKNAINAYLGTPIDIGKEVWIEMGWWIAFKHWVKGFKVKLEEKK